MSGGTLFHIPADLTKKDLLDKSLSTMGTRKVPSSALLVTAAFNNMYFLIKEIFQLYLDWDLFQGSRLVSPLVQPMVKKLAGLPILILMSEVS